MSPSRRRWLEELLDHAQGNPKTSGHTASRAPSSASQAARIRSRKSREMIFMPQACLAAGVTAADLFNPL
jgi:hypothetical protein